MSTVRDSLVPFVRVSMDATVGRALAELDKSQARYAVVLDATDHPCGLVSREQLTRLDPNSKIALDAALVIVNSDVTLDQLASRAGLIVGKPGILVRDGDQLTGVLEASVLAKHIAATGYATTRGSELPGNPRTPFLYWICPACHTEYPVLEYNRSTPPRCEKDNTLLTPPR